MTSTHEVPVMVLDVIEKHPNADKLGIFRPFGSYTVVIALDCWKEGDLVAYIQPDSIVDTSRPEFAFLAVEGKDKMRRVTVKKLRQVYSQGCLVPAPEGSKVGDDVATILGVEHWNPPEEVGGTKGNIDSTPKEFAYLTKYDLDTYHKYWRTMVDGEIVNVTEKLHGSQMKIGCINGEVYVGGRNFWMKEDVANIYWTAFNNDQSLKEFILNNQNVVLYGEVYGKVQKNFHYDAKPGNVKFRAFDIRRPDGTYLDVAQLHELCIEYSVPLVPQLGNIPFNKDEMEKLAEEPSLLGNCPCREGIVIKPIVERANKWIGRTILKLVSNKYLEKS